MIHARGLSRRFSTGQGELTAVRGVDLDIGPDELVGFLGPNGAGKTTTLRMLATLLAPSSGEASLAGCDLRRDPEGVRRHLGYVAQSPVAGLDRRVGDELVLQARFHGHRKAQARARSSELLHRLELGGLEHRVVSTLSGGQRRRLDIALGLVHAPSVLFLDEPSIGLDPHSRAALWEHIRSLRSRQTLTVLLSTHYLDEADALCDRLLVLDHGRIIAAGTPGELKQRISGDLVVLTSPDPRAAEAAVRSLPQAESVSVDGGTVRFRAARGHDTLPPLLRALDRDGVPLDVLEVQRPSLDDVFRTLTGHRLREEPAEPREATDAA